MLPHCPCHDPVAVRLLLLVLAVVAAAAAAARAVVAASVLMTGIELVFVEQTRCSLVGCGLHMHYSSTAAGFTPPIAAWSAPSAQPRGSTIFYFASADPRTVFVQSLPCTRAQRASFYVFALCAMLCHV